MRRAAWALVVVAVVAAACGDASAPATNAPPPPATTLTADTTAPTTTTAATAGTATSRPPPGTAEVLDAFLGAIAAGDADGAFALVAPDATWVLFDESEIQLGAPLPADLAWVPDVVGVTEPTAAGVVRGLIDLYVALGTEFSLAECEPAGSLIDCDLTAHDALTRLAGEPATGTVGGEVEGGLITDLDLHVVSAGGPGWGPDEFKRWAAVTRPDGIGATTLLAWARLMVPLAAQWDREGRPDAPAPPDFNTTDPVAIVRGWLDFRNIGDWVSTVALLGGAALDDPLASREQFEAEEVLEREITISNCEVLLADERGTRLGCDVAVSDIVTRTAGVVATNPNQSTFVVLDRRIVELPDFYPSSFRAEEAIEEWAQANSPDAYAAACPDGIAGQSPLERLSCARFVADQRTGWEPVVAALGS